jgi:hypothetical protein
VIVPKALTIMSVDGATASAADAVAQAPAMFLLFIIS